MSDENALIWTILKMMARTHPQPDALRQLLDAEIAPLAARIDGDPSQCTSLGARTLAQMREIRSALAG